MKKVFLIILLVLAIGTFAVHQASMAKAKPGDLVLTSKKVKSAPSDAGSSEWNQAKEAKMVLTGAGKFEGKNIELKTKSVYTKDEILFRFEWPDKDPGNSAAVNGIRLRPTKTGWGSCSR
jgi:hypothetical protein